ncbi:hypothetical protein HanIR_Chr16g0836581 [Helianthus annuus]|nr:hypothetical protein HanIR_Chr16g0836581 [Helianthus annuus]
MRISDSQIANLNSRSSPKNLAVVVASPTTFPLHPSRLSSFRHHSPSLPTYHNRFHHTIALKNLLEFLNISPSD